MNGTEILYLIEISPPAQISYEWATFFVILAYIMFMGLLALLVKILIKRFRNTPKSTTEKRCNRKLDALK